MSGQRGSGLHSRERAWPRGLGVAQMCMPWSVSALTVAGHEACREGPQVGMGWGAAPRAKCPCGCLWAWRSSWGHHLGRGDGQHRQPCLVLSSCLQAPQPSVRRRGPVAADVGVNLLGHKAGCRVWGVSTAWGHIEMEAEGLGQRRGNGL